MRSKQEKSMRRMYPGLQYEPHTLEYTTNHKATPDFYLGVSQLTGKRVYIELKEWLEVDTLNRELAIMRSNPTVEIRYVYDSASVAAVMRLKREGIVAHHGWALIPGEWLQECGVDLVTLLTQP